MSAQPTAAPGRPEQSARDPVCGKNVAASGDALWQEYVEVTYFFCSQSRLDRFNQDTDIFTVDSPVGALATRDRGLRSAHEAGNDPGQVLFEQSHT
jgi:YHS domain-containing protein